MGFLGITADNLYVVVCLVALWGLLRVISVLLGAFVKITAGNLYVVACLIAIGITCGNLTLRG